MKNFLVNTLLTLFIISNIRLMGQDKEFFIDPRDNQEYEITTIKVYHKNAFKKRVWFAENLNYKTEKSECYKGYEVFCENLGRLYNWSEAKNSCPQGWHIATFKDWNEMFGLYGGLRKAGKKIQKKPIKIEMGGFGEPNGDFYDVGVAAYFWDDEPHIIGTAGSINIFSDSEVILHQRVFSYHKNSVRCVKDY